MNLERLDTSLERPDASLDRSDVSSEPLNSEEDQILESISRLRVEINRIESTTGPSKRTNCIRDEIKRLGSRLAYCKIQARERTDQVAQD
jgi:hypothetical protein